MLFNPYRLIQWFSVNVCNFGFSFPFHHWIFESEARNMDNLEAYDVAEVDVWLAFPYINHARAFLRLRLDNIRSTSNSTIFTDWANTKTIQEFKHLRLQYKGRIESYRKRSSVFCMVSWELLTFANKLCLLDELSLVFTQQHQTTFRIQFVFHAAYSVAIALFHCTIFSSDTIFLLFFFW